MLTVEERYPCGKSIGQRGRANVYYLCKCKCGKEFIVTGDELSKHPYSCGCTPKPKSGIYAHFDDTQNVKTLAKISGALDGKPSQGEMK